MIAFSSSELRIARGRGRGVICEVSWLKRQENCLLEIPGRITLMSTGETTPALLEGPLKRKPVPILPKLGRVLRLLFSSLPA